MTFQTGMTHSQQTARTLKMPVINTSSSARALAAQGILRREENQARHRQLLRPRPLRALSERREGRRRNSLPCPRAIRQARVLRHARCHQATPLRRERPRRGVGRRTFPCRPQQSLCRHGELWLAESAAESAHRIQRRLGQRNCQRPVLATHDRRPDPRQQRIRRRRI